MNKKFFDTFKSLPPDFDSHNSIVVNEESGDVLSLPIHKLETDFSYDFPNNHPGFIYEVKNSNLNAYIKPYYLYIFMGLCCIFIFLIGIGLISVYTSEDRVIYYTITPHTITPHTITPHTITPHTITPPTITPPTITPPTITPSKTINYKKPIHYQAPKF